MKSVTRRDFIKGSLAAGAVLLAPNSRVLGANEDIRVGVIGFRGQGGGHISRYLGIDGVRLTALCDADSEVLGGQVAKADQRGQKVKAYTDVRKMLDDPNIDAVSIATPNHWHALMTIWACQAGKDVYVEKPVCHNIWEGKKMVEAARKHKRIVQTGTQSRSSEAIPEAFEFIKAGNIGAIKVARGLCYKRRASIGKVSGPQRVPLNVNYNLWTGPAPLGPLMRKSLHYDWHWAWSTGNGDLGNQGIHQMDICRWATGQSGFPKRVLSVGGRFGYIDDGETANTQFAILDYDPIPIVFEVRGLTRKTGDTGMDYYKKVTDIGVVIECEGGYVAIGSNGGGWAYDNDGKRLQQFAKGGPESHQQNFINVVRSRKVGDLKADIQEGYLSSALCHMANISHQAGQTVPTEQIAEHIKSDAVMTESFGRFQEHLAANEVDLKQTAATLGADLKFDADKLQFEHGEENVANVANSLVSRNYRKPFVVPEQV